MWAEILDCERVGRDDDFFTLGGNSIAAARMIGVVNRDFQVRLPLSILFEARTVAALGAAIARRVADPG